MPDEVGSLPFKRRARVGMEAYSLLVTPYSSLNKKAARGRPFAIVHSLLRFLRRLGVRLGVRLIQQLDQCHRRIVAVAEAELQDAQIAAVAIGITRAELGEQLDHHLT